MADPAPLADHLAQRLRAARRARGLSLDAVAQLSGVSRSMVSQIERGASSPTVATLWNLARALSLDLCALLAPQPPAIQVIRAEQAPVLTAAAGVTIRIMSPADSAGRHEVYDIAFAPAAILESRAHAAGTVEHLTVLDGTLQVRAGEQARDLGAGDTARYPADTAHRLTAGPAPARALLIVQGAG